MNIIFQEHMTNSLFKDSHITHNCRSLSAPYYSGQRANKGKGSSATENNNGTRVYNKPADKTSFCGFFNSGIYTNKGVKKLINMAAVKPAVFTALFAIPLTCIMRPAAIMALPSDSKHKDDKKYAAAHSVASGVIGYVFSSLIFGPLGAGMKKISNNLPEYAEKYPKLAYLKLSKNGTEKSLSYMDRAALYFSQAPETILAAPKALVTIALIPPILKYVFGWEKNKKGSKPAVNNKAQSLIDENPALVNFKSASASVENSKNQDLKPKAVAFSGSYKKGEEVFAKSKFFGSLSDKFKAFNDKLSDKIADKFAYVLGTAPVKNVIEKSTSPNLYAHLSALTGVTLSGFYVRQTLKNKNLDEQKRNTLAINQALVCAVSTVGAYAINKAVNTRRDNFIEKFLEKNSPLSPNAKRAYRTGIKSAFSLMVFGTIYRFLSPVFVTPIANKLGNRLNDKKQAKLAQEKATGGQKG